MPEHSQSTNLACHCSQLETIAGKIACRDVSPKYSAGNMLPPLGNSSFQKTARKPRILTTLIKLDSTEALNGKLT